MRRKIIIPIVMVAAVIALLVGVLVVPARGGSGTTSTVAKTTAKDARIADVASLLQPIVQANKGVTNGQADYSLVVKPTMTASSTTSPSPLAGLLSNGVTVSGTVKVDAKAKTADATVNVALGNGSTMLSGEVYWNGKQGWVKYNDTWYSLPPQALKKLQQAEAKHQQGMGTAKKAKDTKVAGLLSKLGIDPQKWLNPLTITSPDTSTGLTQVSSGFDVKLIASDLVKLFQSPQVQQQMQKAAHHMGAQHMAKTKANGKFKHAMSAAQLAQIPGQAATAIIDPKAALWVDSSAKTPGTAFNKFEASATIVPPADAKAPVSQVTLDLKVDNISLGATSIANPVSNPKPWSQLQKSIQGLQKMFQGILKH
jgi:hypothetical protein